MKLAPAQVEEVQQLVRTRLLVAEPGGRPKLAEYSGRGELAAWVQAVALRVALNLVRRPRQQVPFDEQLLPAVGTDRDPELEYARRLYGAEFAEALRQGLSELTPRERNLLRHHHLHGLSLDQLSALYRVHRATIARWLSRARDHLNLATRTQLALRLKLGEHEVESVMRLVPSQLDVSMNGTAEDED
jgi:RNA polymerase sigma-70 factor (ECF subfamily)